MTISLTQAILLGLFCGIAKTCIPYTWGAFLFNTVIGNAVIVGAVMGDMKSAMIIGASLQLIYLGVISAGGNQPSDPCLASYIAIPFAMVSGLDTTAAVALAVPLGLLGPQITNLLYLAAGFFAQKGDKFIEKGDAKSMTRWAVIYVGIIRCIVFGVPVAIGLYFGAGALEGVLDNIPQFLTNGLSAIGSCLPAVGFAIIASLISKPKYMPFFFGGFFLIQYTHIGTIPLLLLGLFLTFLYLTFTAKDYLNSTDDDDDFEDDEDEEDVAVAAGERILSRKDILKSWLLYWITAEVGHSFERMQAPMFCTAMNPALKKFYKDDKEHYIDIKTGLMGPLAGLGDTISWSTLMYLFIGLFLPWITSPGIAS